MLQILKFLRTNHNFESIFPTIFSKHFFNQSVQEALAKPPLFDKNLFDLQLTHWIYLYRVALLSNISAFFNSSLISKTISDLSFLHFL